MTAAADIFLYLLAAVTDRPPYYRNTPVSKHRGLYRPCPRFDKMVQVYLILTLNPNANLNPNLAAWENYRKIERRYNEELVWTINQILEAGPSGKHYRKYLLFFRLLFLSYHLRYHLSSCSRLLRLTLTSAH